MDVTDSNSIVYTVNDKIRLQEILNQTTSEIDAVNEECNVLLELLMRKRYKNISETKPSILKVGSKRYRDEKPNHYLKYTTVDTIESTVTEPKAGSTDEQDIAAKVPTTVAEASVEA